MPKVKNTSKPNDTPSRKALSPENREKQLIALAYDLVEQRLRDGTATSQETTHFLKMGSSKERLEKELAEARCNMLKAKSEALESYKRQEELYAEAIKAMRHYGGHDEEDEELF